MLLPTFGYLYKNRNTHAPLCVTFIMRYLILFFAIIYGVSPAFTQIEGVIESRNLRLKLLKDTIHSDSTIKNIHRAYQYFVDQNLLPHEDAAACLNNLGVQYLDLNEYPKALEYFHASLDMYRKLQSQKSKQNFIVTAHNIAIVYKQYGDIENRLVDSGKFYYMLALKEALDYKHFPQERLNGIFEDAAKYYHEYAYDEEIAALKNLKYLNKPAAEFNALTDKGRVISLSSYSGQWVLLDIWASWCGPCIKQFPKLKHIDSTFKKVKIIGISVDEDIESWKYRIEEYRLPWVQALDQTPGFESIATLYGAYRIPLTVLIDPQGIIRAYGLRGDELIETIETLVK